MLIPRGDTFSRLVLTVLIGATSFVGDNLLYGLKTPTLRAIADNLTHALVGGLSWTLIIKLSNKSIVRNIFGIIVCFLLSSLIDLDHFLLAKSWRLQAEKVRTECGFPSFPGFLLMVQIWRIRNWCAIFRQLAMITTLMISDANHLGSKRPILHCSIIPVLIWLAFWIGQRIFHLNSTLGYYLWVIITGFLSHHVRDATRRGLWFGLLGSTPPIPYYLYLLIAVVLPYFIYSLMPDYVIKDDLVYSLVQAV